MDDDTAQAVPFLDSFWALATPVPHERSQAAPVRLHRRCNRRRRS